MDFLGSDTIIRYGMIGITSLFAIIFVIVLASLLYHWHYYGIGFVRRWILITIFGGVGIALIAAAYGLMIKIT